MFDKVDVDEMVKIGEEAIKKSADELNKLFDVQNRVYRWMRVAKKPGKTIAEFQTSQ
jgi:hypothetical protein